MTNASRTALVPAPPHAPAAAPPGKAKVLLLASPSSEPDPDEDEAEVDDDPGCDDDNEDSPLPLPPSPHDDEDSDGDEPRAPMPCASSCGLLHAAAIPNGPPPPSLARRADIGSAGGALVVAMPTAASRSCSLWIEFSMPGDAPPTGAP